MLSLPSTDSEVPSKYGALGRKANILSSWKILERFPVLSAGSCFCVGSVDTHEEIERRPLFVQKSEEDKVMLLTDGDDDCNKVVANQPLAIQIKPQIVMLRVSMHCNGCARKVEKHVSKIDGVSSYKVDLESKMVVIIGDIVPVEVLESVSKVKRAEFWGSAQ